MPEITPGVDEAKARKEWHLAGVIFFALIALIVFYETFIILEPFFAPIILGAVLVTVTFPIFRRVRQRMHGHDNRDFLMLGGVGLAQRLRDLVGRGVGDRLSPIGARRRLRPGNR